MTEQTETRQFVVPLAVVTQSDLRRLIAEVETVDNAYVTTTIHERIGHGSDERITTSGTLDECAQANGLKLFEQSHRSVLLAELRKLKEHAPIIHITFASTAKHEVLAKMAGWLREKIHPQALIEVGLQPELIGGAHIRTTNRVFDLSVRAQLAEGREVIVRELEALRGVR